MENKPHIDIEEMSSSFTKFHLRGPWEEHFNPVMHKFDAPDMGDPHDHPWSFRSTILYGYYIEEIYDWDKRRDMPIARIRNVGDSFLIDAEHIHRIVEVAAWGCYSLIVPIRGPTRKSGFWQFREDGRYHRKWDETEWTKVPNGV